MKFKDFKIGKKLTVGFGVMLILLLVLGLVSFFGFNTYREIARDNVLMGRVQANLLMSRLMVKDYIKSQNPASVKTFNEKMSLLKELIQEAQTTIKDSERADKVDFMEAEILKYEEGFKQIVDYYQTRDNTVQELVEIGDSMQNKINDIINTAFNDGDVRAGFYGGKFIGSMLSARIYVYQYLQSNDISKNDAVKNEIENNTNSILSDLKNEIQNPRRRQLLTEIEAHINEYLIATEVLKETIVARNYIIDNTLDRVGPEIADAAEWVKLDIKDQQDTLGPAIIMLIIIISIISVVLAFIISRIIINSIKNPVNEILEIAKAMMRGDLNKKSEIDQKDEIGDLAIAFTSIQDKISGLLSETGGLINSINNGQLDRRADNSNYKGGYKELVDGINGICDSFVAPINVTAEYVDRISKGDLPPKISDDYKGDFNEIKNNLNQLIDVLGGLLGEINGQVQNINNGKLDARADSSKYVGDWAKLIKGVNDLNDAFIAPLNITAEYIERISKGDIPPKIVDEYKGDFNEIKNNINQLIDNLTTFIQEMEHMSHEHDLGDIDIVMTEDKFVGSYKSMANGVNKMVNGHITVKKKAMAAVSEMGKGNFDVELEQFPGKKAFINDTIEELRLRLRNVNDEVRKLIVDSKVGKLENRAESSKFNGDWATLMDGINEMLDAILLPITESIRILANIRGGNLREKVSGTYEGDHKKMQDAVNGVHAWLTELIEYVTKIAQGDMSAQMQKASSEDQIHEWLIMMRESIKSLVNDSNKLVEAGKLGELSTRADAKKHKGAYKDVIDGLNNILDHIIEPINESINVLDNLSNGDFTKKMNGSYRGDTLKLKESLNATIDSINEILSQVRSIVEEVTSGSMQVSDAATGLSQGATEQAASLEEITSSMSEISSQTKTNASNADQANLLTGESRNAAEKGNSEMVDLNSAMGEISKSSQDISKIIKVIDEIAFQTNLLALNAAVEAARAGRHGKGFAVVAEEVRNLAARSAKAAKETSDLIENSIKTVDTGSELAMRTSEMLDEIMKSTIKVSDIVGEIATSSNEQAEGIEQINEGLQQIDKVTQTNTASAEESASAAEELSGQARNLRDMISRFTLDETKYQSYSNEFDGKFTSSGMLASSQYSEKRLQEPENEFNEDDDNPNDIINLDEDDFGKY